MKVEHFYQATSLEEAYALLIESKDNHIVAGGAWMKLSLKKANTLIALDNLWLDQINESTHFIEVGAMTSLRAMEKHPLIAKLGNGTLQKAISSIMGVSIRNIATIGGSVISKFGFSDLIPVLLSLDTSLVFHQHGEISLSAFLESNTIQNDILITVKIKKKPGSFYFKKVATTALDFAILNIQVAKSDDGYQIIVGSRPGGAIFAHEAMNYINARTIITKEVIQETAKIVKETVSFSSNGRASDEYRRELAFVYTSRGLKEVSKLEN